MAALLKLCIGLQNEKSVIRDSFFTSPLKLGVPDQKSGRITIILMMASAGILKGDEFKYDVHCDIGTKATLTEQSYTKIFDTGNGGARKEQYIRVEQGASLYYCPCAVIPFKGSRYDGYMKVSLDRRCEFAYADIVSAGRIGMGERFMFRHYENCICVEIENMPVWLDHCLLEPDRMSLDQLIFFDDYTHQGTFYYYGEKQKQFLEWYLDNCEELAKTIFCGITEAREGVCFRALAHTAQDIEDVFSSIADMLELK